MRPRLRTMDGSGQDAEVVTFSPSDAVADISTLPEACIVYILALTSPLDVCRIRAVATWLLPAVESDALWLRFLPHDYPQILARSAQSPPPLHDFPSKKDLYFRLCDSPLLIGDGNKMFWLEKKSGKKCYMLGARELTIIWGDTPQYWTWFSVPESRFAEIAYLHAVCWLEIKGKMNARMLSDDTNYGAYLVFSLKEGCRGFDDIEVKSSIKMNGDETSVRRNYLRRRVMNRRALRSSEEPIPYPQRRVDGWLEIELGDFFCKRGEDDSIQVEIYQLGGHWKRGLVVEGIEIRPKYSV